MIIPFIQLEPTNKCNLKCITCSRDTLKNIGSMSFHDFKTIIDKLPSLKAVKLQGMGEPLLHPQILDFISYLKQKNINVYTAVNGTMFDKIDLEKFCVLIDRVEISFDSPYKQDFEKIRNGADFDNVLDGIRKFNKYATLHNVIVSINYVYQKDNIKSIDDMIKLCSDENIKILNLNPVQDWVIKSSEKKDKINKLYDKNFDKEKIKKTAEQYHIDINFQKEFSSYKDCHWYEKTFYVTWDGFVTPCCLRPNSDEINFGNILSAGFLELWNSFKWESFRNNLIQNISNNECHRCAYYKSS